MAGERSSGAIGGELTTRGSVASVTKPWLVFLLCLVASGAHAGGEPDPNCPYGALVASYSSACTDSCLNADSSPGSHPAVSSASSSFPIGYGYNLGASSTLGIDVGYFGSATHVGGSMLILPASSFSATASSGADVFDCLTFSGYVGAGTAHIPIHLTGHTLISWSTDGAFIPSEGTNRTFSRLIIGCAAYSYGTSTLIDCPNSDSTFQVGQDIDTTVELVFAFTFGDPTTIQFGPHLSAGLGYGSNGGEGTLQGMVDLDLEAELLPMYVVASGSIIPNATVSAMSGFDYLHPTPEPRAATSAAVALAALVTLRREARASRRRAN